MSILVIHPIAPMTPRHIPTAKSAGLALNARRHVTICQDHSMSESLSNFPAIELRERLASFADWRHENLQGDEKGEAQVFLDRFFQAFGWNGVFEAGATLEYRVANDNGGTSFADLLWKPRVLIEMKKAGVDLSRHFRQAFDYWARAVPNRPRFVILCNFDEFWIYDFENQLDEPVDRVDLDDLESRWEALGFMLPEQITPTFGNDLVAVTRDAAADVAKVFMSLRDRGVAVEKAQRFALQCVMAMFAEDIGLLPRHFFTQALADARTPQEAYDFVGGLFREMNTPGITPGGRFAGTPYFNGGLFREVVPQELTAQEVDYLREAAATTWSDVRPEIFGTLFEGSMDAGERHASGAHFTSQADIARVVGPVIVEPWRAKIAQANSIPKLNALLEEMSQFRVLDPSCGSGNFLYVAYREMRRLEREVLEKIRERRTSENRAAMQSFQYVSPEQFLGMDLNPFAVEVAKVTMLLGKKLANDEMHEVGGTLPLDNLDSTIVHADALFHDWPKADAIIGNPPYLGRRSMIEALGAPYCSRLDQKFGPHGVADLVTYWFPLAHDRLPVGGRAGFVATKSIKHGDGRKASLDYVLDNDGTIIDAVATMPWSGEAQVTVSIVNWQKGGALPATRTLWLNAEVEPLELPYITAALSPQIDLRSAKRLEVNAGAVFQGQTMQIAGAFKLNTMEASRYIRADARTAQVLHPILGGNELLDDTVLSDWVIDIPFRSADDAWLQYPRLMERLENSVLPQRRDRAAAEAEANAEIRRGNPRAHVHLHHAHFYERWWQLGYRRENYLNAVADLPRYLAITRVSSELRGPVLSFVENGIHIEDSAVAFPFQSDYAFGVLQSIVHETWFRERCTTLETRLRYTSKTVFDSFPWPQAPDGTMINRVSSAAAAIITKRAAAFAAGHSLSAQYNVLRRPGHSDLRDMHQELNSAVVSAYGFDPDEDLLPQILELNFLVAAREQSGEVVTGPGDLFGTQPQTTWAWPAPSTW
ncbi:DNA methyltransferase [Herbiconiux sp. P15]|uniref:DNA methyltransferase n=1 Tax=Herbiconiux liukaitaii TaxID=3342799 RepID=UPI0035B80027